MTLVTLVAGVFAVPVAAGDDQDQVESATVEVAGYPPNPNYIDIPFPGPEANKLDYWRVFAGGIPYCVKKHVDGNFTNVNRFDLVGSKYTDPETTLRVWLPARPMYGQPGSTVWVVNCSDVTPVAPPAVVNPSPQMYPSCSVENGIWFEVNNTPSTRPVLATPRWINQNGVLKKIKKVEVPPLMVWRELVKADPNSGQDAWIYLNSNEYANGRMGVRRPVTVVNEQKCHDFTEGYSWN